MATTPNSRAPSRSSGSLARTDKKKRNNGITSTQKIN